MRNVYLPKIHRFEDLSVTTQGITIMMAELTNMGRGRQALTHRKVSGMSRRHLFEYCSDKSVRITKMLRLEKIDEDASG